jgi:hypothetical protein
MAEVESYDRELVLAGLHIQAETFGDPTLWDGLGFGSSRGR